MLEPVQTGAEAIKATAEAVKIALDVVYRFVDRRKAANSAKWAYVQEAALAAKTLVAEHAETIRIITAPARLNSDLASTAMLLRDVVDTGKLPLAYDALHGELEQLIEDKEIFSEAGSTIRSLRRQLAVFQYEAFMVKYSSWGMADAIEWVVEAVRLLGEVEPRLAATEARLGELRARLNNQNAWWQFRTLPGRPAPEEAPAEPDTAVVMETYVRDWLKAWFEDVQQTLYGREGINRLAAKLEMISDLHK